MNPELKYYVKRCNLHTASFPTESCTLFPPSLGWRTDGLRLLNEDDIYRPQVPRRSSCGCIVDSYVSVSGSRYLFPTECIPIAKACAVTYFPSGTVVNLSCSSKNGSCRPYQTCWSQNQHAGVAYYLSVLENAPFRTFPESRVAFH